MTDVQPALRADAARNRGLVLAAAEAEFAARGLTASVADIAERAGVAKGTVFRHFATKEALIVAIVAEHIEALTTVARSLADAADSGAALLHFLTAAADQRRQRDITFLLSFSADDQVVLRVREELHDAIGALLDRARADGVIRADVTATDLFLLMCAPVHVVENLPGAPDDLWQRYLGIIFDGLRTEGSTPLPRPAPAWF